MEHYLVPQQKEGPEKNLDANVEYGGVTEARDEFVQVMVKMMDVNNWGSYAKGGGATFQLTDSRGIDKAGNAARGDYIKVDIPGPGTKEGDGYDWVRIEEMAYDEYAEEDRETFAIRVRPSAKPASGTETAHFFSKQATSTFVAERAATTVHAAYYGRNETLNYQEHSLLDKVRNRLVGVAAWLGMSDMQWKALIEGFIS